MEDLNKNIQYVAVTGLALSTFVWLHPASGGTLLEPACAEASARQAQLNFIQKLEERFVPHNAVSEIFVVSLRLGTECSNAGHIYN